MYMSGGLIIIRQFIKRLNMDSATTKAVPV